MSDIKELWSEIEQSNEVGLLKRLYTEGSCVFIYVIFQNPERHCGIAISYNKKINIDTTPYANLRDLQVSLQTDNSFNANNLLIIKLLHNQSRDVFAAMCENMIQSTLALRDEKQVVKKVLNQLEKWKTLFEKLKGIGLSTSEQQGLYGELHFLQKFITNKNEDFALNTWVGVDKEVRDFQYDDWALEVKTTAGNNHQKVNISSERQLDESLLKNLFLFHLSVEASKMNGESLNTKVDTLRTLLQENVSALNVFNNKLLEVGYFDKHKQLYDERCYQIRDENFYKIESEFPRIKEKDVRDGVGDVKYSIILSQCNEYLITESLVFETIIPL